MLPPVSTVVHVPAFFLTFAELYLLIDEKLARQLWEALRPSYDLRYQCERVDELHGRPDAIMRFAQLLPARQILEACERLAPADGQTVRRKDIRVLEQHILSHVGPDGR